MGKVKDHYAHSSTVVLLWHSKLVVIAAVTFVLAATAAAAAATAAAAAAAAATNRSRSAVLPPPPPSPQHTPGRSTMSSAQLLQLEHQSGASGFTDVFVSGRDGYHTYRIPALVRVPGTEQVLLFAEGRKLSSADHGWNDIVLKRSPDNGVSWGPLQVVYSESRSGHLVTIGNPAPVAIGGSSSSSSGSGNGSSNGSHILLVACRNNREVVSLISQDGGRTWPSGPATNLTSEAVLPGWSWVATGPPGGLRLASSSGGGRLIIASDHIDAGGAWGSHVMISDDAGAHWRVGGQVNAGAQGGGNECQVAPTSNGSLLLNMRTGHGIRQFSWSHDDGDSWSEPIVSPSLPGKYGGGSCEGSTVQLPTATATVATATSTTKVAATSATAAAAAAATATATATAAAAALQSKPTVQTPETAATTTVKESRGGGDGTGNNNGGLLLFSTPYAQGRENMTIFVSRDNGVTWVPRVNVDPGPSAYSSLLALNSTAAILAYEAGGYATIRVGTVVLD